MTNVACTDCNLKILYQNNEKDATCNLAESKLTCVYDCNEYYYGLIKIPKSTITLGEGNNLDIDNELTLQQNVELTYEKAYIFFKTTASTSYFELHIYVTETDIEDNAFYQVDVLFNSNNKMVDCKYTTTESSPPEKYLSCKYTSNKVNLLQLTGAKTSGSIQWKNSPIPDFEKDVKLKFEVKKIYGYNLYFDNNNNKWKFYLHAS